MGDVLLRACPKNLYVRDLRYFVTLKMTIHSPPVFDHLHLASEGRCRYATGKIGYAAIGRTHRSAPTVHAVGFADTACRVPTVDDKRNHSALWGRVTDKDYMSITFYLLKCSFIAAAARRPSPIARMTVAPPRTMSPPA